MTISLQAIREDLRRSFINDLREGGRLALRGPALLVALLVAIGALSIVLVDQVKGRVLLSSHFRVDPSAIEIGSLPAFVPERVAKDLRKLSDVPPRSILDPALEDQLRESLGQHPWVKRVVAVHRIFPSRIALELEMRRPAALVDVEAWRVTIDETGYVLEDKASLAPEGLPVIRGDRKSVPKIPRVGATFRTPSVLNGLSVVADVARVRDHRAKKLLGGMVIDVTNVGGKRGSEISLELASGCAVEWGSAAIGALGPIELPVSTKLDLLAMINDQNPNLQGLAKVNVTVDPPFVTPDH